jgi:hypothetical protein
MKYIAAIALVVIIALPVYSQEYTDFEGAAGRISRNGDHVTIEPVIDPLGRHHSAWIDFRLDGVQGQDITFVIENVEGISEFERDDKRMVFSCGGGWNYMAEGDYDPEGGTFTFSHAFDCDSAEIATYHPYTAGRLDDYLDSISGDGHVSISKIGETLEGRDIRLVSITDSSDSPKEDVFIIARQHPAETAGSYLLEGLIDRMLENPDALSRLRLFIVPMANVDGVADGRTRSNTQRCDGEECDMNRNWDGSANPDVNVIKDEFDRLDEDYGADLFIDLHGYAGGEERSGFLTQGGNADAFADILDDKSDWGNPKGLFRSIEDACSGGTAKAYGCRLGAEPSFTFEPDQGNGKWTTSSLRRNGGYMADTIIEFFDAQAEPTPSQPAGPDAPEQQPNASQPTEPTGVSLDGPPIDTNLSIDTTNQSEPAQKPKSHSGGSRKRARTVQVEPQSAAETAAVRLADAATVGLTISDAPSEQESAITSSSKSTEPAETSTEINPSIQEDFGQTVTVGLTGSDGPHWEGIQDLCWSL